MSIQLRKLHLLIQHFNILQLRHGSFITQSLKEIHSGRETGLIDTGPFTKFNENSMEAKSQQNFYKKAAIIVFSSTLSLWGIHFQNLVQKTRSGSQSTTSG